MANALVLWEFPSDPTFANKGRMWATVIFPRNRGGHFGHPRVSFELSAWNADYFERAASH